MRQFFVKLGTSPNVRQRIIIAVKTPDENRSYCFASWRFRSSHRAAVVYIPFRCAIAQFGPPQMIQ